jgi:hypothetical protein
VTTSLSDRNVVSLRLSSVLVGVGAVGIASSCVLPWFASDIGSTGGIEAGPLQTAATRPSAIVVVMVLLIGLVAWSYHRVWLLFGVGSALWTLTALVTWLIGVRMTGWLPTAILPDSLATSPGFGVSVGLWGGVLACLGVLRRATDERESGVLVTTRNLWRTLAGIVGLWFLIWSRQAPWVTIDGGPFRRTYGGDAVLVVGDLLGIAQIATGVVLVACVARPGRWTRQAAMCAGIAFAFLVAVIRVAAGAVTWGVERLAQNVGQVDLEGSVSLGYGPIIAIVAGAITATVGLTTRPD